MKVVSRLAWSSALVIAAPALTGCASNQALRMSLSERDDEIRGLKRELTALQGDLVRTRNERDGLQVALEDAALRIQKPPADPGPAPRFPDLDQAGISYGMRGDQVVFTIPSAVTFGAGKASLTAGGEKALDALARRLASEFGGHERFFVEGHTDSDPIRRSGFESNRDLSLERAKAVHAHLVTVGKIDDRRFVLVGHGQYRPIVPNDSSEGKARNRRVEIVVHAEE